MRVSVQKRPDGGAIEGGEPMMTMLRCSGLVVMLAIEVFARIDLREASAIKAILISLTENINTGLTEGEVFWRADMLEKFRVGQVKMFGDKRRGPHSIIIDSRHYYLTLMALYSSIGRDMQRWLLRRNCFH